MQTVRLLRCHSFFAKRLVVGLAVLLAHPAVSSKGSSLLVALTGDSPQGSERTLELAGLGTPSVDARGHIAFEGRLLGPGVSESNDSAIFRITPDEGLGIFLQEGAPLGGTFEELSHGTLGRPIFDEEDRVFFYSTLSGPGTHTLNNEAFFQTSDAGVFELTAREGDPAPSPDRTFHSLGCISGPSFNNGHAAFWARLESDGRGFPGGVFRQMSGENLELIVQTSDPVPDNDTGGLFGSATCPVINAHGVVAFHTSLVGPGFWSANNEAIVTDSPSNDLTIVTQKGDPLPALGVGFSMGDIDVPRINNNGHIAFVASINLPDNSSQSNGGVFTNAGSSGVRVIARAGEHAPGQPANVVF